MSDDNDNDNDNTNPKVEAARARSEALSWQAEHASWQELAALAEIARMPRSMVSAIRGGCTLLRLAGAPLEQVAVARASVNLAIDAHRQHAKRRASA